MRDYWATIGRVTEPALETQSIHEVLTGLVRHPVTHLVVRWNWKSAVLSSAIRSALFFAANLSAGLNAARAAFVTELVFRCITSGFYGAITQAFRNARPVWAGTAAAMLLPPLITHFIEFAVHRLRGTARLMESIAVSIGFTALSSAFNLFAMRRGALVVDGGCDSIWSNLRRMPSIVVGFAAEGRRTLRCLAKRAVPIADALSGRGRSLAGGPPPPPTVKSLHLTNVYHPTSGGIRQFYDALLRLAHRSGWHVHRPFRESGARCSAYIVCSSRPPAMVSWSVTETSGYRSKRRSICSASDSKTRRGLTGGCRHPLEKSIEHPLRS